ncbi:TonB-dependent receptor plug domain-containing protein [Sulfuricurvum sp.]|uniref:TonB-dependent receptor plug domain-containing protein n=1 Tax=Sulfuricurvum sp. TaxID=2025608 RepID=UPI003567A1D0
MKFPLCTASLLALTLSASEQPIIDSLNEDMAEAAKMATDTNSNIDYQPFILSILHEDDLSKLGVKTLGEALILVPGVDMATNTMNNRTPIFRGSNSTAYGQSTLAIDGIVVNDDLFSNYNAYLDLPIELIDRIEVVRGSGSFIEGVNGYAGTINVITHAKSELQKGKTGAIFASGGSSGAAALGGWSQYHGETWKLSLDAFTQQHNEQTPISVTDASGRLGYAQLGMKQSGFGIAYENGGFDLRGRYNNYQNDSAFGNLNILPNPEGTIKEPSWYIQGKYTLPLARDMSLILKTSVMESSWMSDSSPLPPNFIYNKLTLPDGYWASLMIKSRRISSGASLHYNGFDAHSFTAGIESTWDEVVDSYSHTTNKITGIGIVDYTGTPLAFINAASAKRQTTNLYLTDMITVNSTTAIALTGGMIRTSDINSDVYGRAAVVYQPNHNNIFKFMAASGQRYPSFQEMYLAPSPYGTGNPNLNHENVRSVETQYLRKLNTNLTAGINLFYIANSQQIVRNQTGVFQNYGKSTIQGVEAETHGKLTQNNTFSLSYSYIHGEVEDIFNNAASLPYAASHLVKATYAYDFAEDWTLGGIWHYIGDKKRYIPDTRDSLAGYNTLDLALGWNMSTHQGWYVQAALKDITNTIVRYPAPASTYNEDYPIFGRTFWIRSGWKF